MAKRGNSIENPATRERLTWLETASGTEGELLRFELSVRPGGRARLPFIHPRQTKSIEVVSGTMRHRIGDDERNFHAGESATVAPGVPHEWWNFGDEDAHAIVEFRPALNTETFIESLWSLAREERRNAGAGVPNILRLAVWLTSTFEGEVYLREPSVFSQKVLFAMLAPVGRMLGYRTPQPEQTDSTELPGRAMEELAP